MPRHSDGPMSQSVCYVARYVCRGAIESMNRKSLAALVVLALGVLVACSNGGSNVGQSPAGMPGTSDASSEPPLTATPKAVCGPGSRSETDLQGRVTQEDHDSGRTAGGFTCNTELVGQYITPNAKGTVGGFKVERYVDKAGHDCAYYDTTLLFPTNLLDQTAGVNVLDMSNPAKPVLTDSLRTPAMLSPHESLVVSKQRGVLAAVLGNAAFGPGIVDVYDIAQDCRHPVLKSSLPIGLLGHESGMAPDGKTFYSASPNTPTLTAVDISDSSLPLPLVTMGIYSHGLSISDDGNRAYVASLGFSSIPQGISGGAYPALIILDVSEIQSRAPNPTFKEISRLQWDSITIPQNAIPITVKGHPYLVEIDEFSSNKSKGGDVAANGAIVGAGRIIDIGDEKNPKVISNLRLEVHQAENRSKIANDPGAQSLIGGYAGHYCNVPTRHDPTIVACSMILSGLRVFDIRDPYHPREVAYFNAPVNPASTSTTASASNLAMSSPSFVPERKEIWYTDGYSGFYAVRVTNNAWQ